MKISFVHKKLHRFPNVISPVKYNFRHVLSTWFQSWAKTYSCRDISFTADIGNSL